MPPNEHWASVALSGTERRAWQQPENTSNGRLEDQQLSLPAVLGAPAHRRSRDLPAGDRPGPRQGRQRVRAAHQAHLADDGADSDALSGRPDQPEHAEPGDAAQSDDHRPVGGEAAAGGGERAESAYLLRE